MNVVSWFEIPVKDMKRARAFQCQEDPAKELVRVEASGGKILPPPGVHRTVGLHRPRARHRGEPDRARVAQVIEAKA